MFGARFDLSSVIFLQLVAYNGFRPSVGSAGVTWREDRPEYRVTYQSSLSISWPTVEGETAARTNVFPRVTLDLVESGQQQKCIADVPAVGGDDNKLSMSPTRRSRNCCLLFSRTYYWQLDRRLLTLRQHVSLVISSFQPMSEKCLPSRVKEYRPLLTQALKR